MTSDPFLTPKATLDVPAPEYQGLGGWLALLGVGLFRVWGRC